MLVLKDELYFKHLVHSLTLADSPIDYQNELSIVWAENVNADTSGVYITESDLAKLQRKLKRQCRKKERGVGSEI